MPYIQPLSHITFILKPEADIVKDAIWSLNATGGGIETFPICNYLLHSLFLKLTGAQEQKLKCICWELACRDYEYRYDRFERNRYSECSSYNDKCMVYNDLLDGIKKHEQSFSVSDAVKDEILNDWKTSARQLFDNSLLVESYKRQYDEYKILIDGIQRDWIMKDKQLFAKKENIPAAAMTATCGLSLHELFTGYAYTERNRCAHNTRSYQHNLSSPDTMISKEYKLHNYFLYISIMLLLDMIYMKLFKIYLEKQR